MILVVDDDPDTAFLLATHLERAGMAAETAATITEAVALLARADAVLSDRCLGDEDGMMLFANGRPANIRFAMLLTGDEVHIVDAKAQRFDDVVRKPVDAKQLVARLREVLR